MCGIVGLISLSGNKNWIEKGEWFSKALFVDTLRGKHSTGMCCVSYKDLYGQPFIYKKAMSGPDYLQLDMVRDTLNDIDKYAIVIGHNRKATIGSITDYNAHPFNHKHITLVHNGTLDSRNGVPDSKEIEVDSKAICKAFAEKSPEEILPKLDGAYALVWYDSNKGTLNLARNKERPLCYTFSEDGDNMFFASEPWMITKLVSNIFKVKKIYELKIGLHMEIDITLEDLRKYQTCPFSILESYAGYWSNFWNDHNYNKSSTRKINFSDAKSKRLMDIGYSYSEKVIFKFTSFSKSAANASYGTIFGKVDTEGHPDDKIVSYQVPLNMLEGNHTENRLFIGTVRDCYYNGSGKGVTIVLDNVLEYIALPEPEDVGLGPVEEIVLGPNGKDITLETFNELTKDGCCFCTANIYAEDAEEILWTVADQPICYDCQEKMAV